MAGEARLKITLQNEAGLYYYATQHYSGAWTVDTQSDIIYIDHLPENWDTGTVITWQRDMKYGGVFRSMTDKYTFAMDARAILQSLMFGGGGVNAYCLMTIWIWSDSADPFHYDVLYPSHVDFTKYKDDVQFQKLSIGTLDNGIYKYFESRRDAVYNIPFWVYDADGETWTTDANFIQHDGIKLLWRGQWISGASPTKHLVINSALGFNHGKHGAVPNDGWHTIFTMSQGNEVQNNGATTFVGNDILNPFLKQGTQRRGKDFPSELNFAGLNESRPYTTSNFCLKDLLPNINGDLSGSIEMKIWVQGKFEGDITVGDSGTNQYLSFVIFEVDQDDQATETSPGSGLWSYIEGIKIALPDTAGAYAPPSSGVFNNEATPNTITLSYDKVYVFGGVWDNQVGTTNGINYELSDLQFFIQSDYNSGTGSPVDAPRFPISVLPAYTPAQVLQKLMLVFDSTQTDARGFPIPTGVGYIGASDFLSDEDVDPADNYDLVPANAWYTTENALRNASGIPYMSISLTDFYNTWFNINYCGLGIEGADTIRVERYGFFFDPTTEILDLGTNVFGLTVEPFTDIMGNLLKVGYKEIKTNNDFGGDNYNFSQEYSLPMETTPKEINCSITGVGTEINEIEKGRAQNNSDDNSPSSSNGNILLETSGDSEPLHTVYDPSGNAHTVDYHFLKKYPTAQSTDDTTPPYLNGTKYPDTCYNLGLTPASNTLRIGSMIRIICDGQEGAGKYVTYRKQYQQNYKDALAPPTSLPGISKNLSAGLIKEVTDIPISSLNTKIFRPYIYNFTCRYPVNMYIIINGNPKGYIKFTPKDGVTRRGYIYRAEQSAGNDAATLFKLLVHGDTPDSDLIIN